MNLSLLWLSKPGAANSVLWSPRALCRAAAARCLHQRARRGQLLASTCDHAESQMAGDDGGGRLAERDSRVDGESPSALRPGENGTQDLFGGRSMSKQSHGMHGDESAAPRQDDRAASRGGAGRSAEERKAVSSSPTEVVEIKSDGEVEKVDDDSDDDGDSVIVRGAGRNKRAGSSGGDR